MHVKLHSHYHIILCDRHNATDHISTLQHLHLCIVYQIKFCSMQQSRCSEHYVYMSVTYLDLSSSTPWHVRQIANLSTGFCSELVFLLLAVSGHGNRLSFLLLFVVCPCILSLRGAAQNGSVFCSRFVENPNLPLY